MFVILLSSKTWRKKYYYPLYLLEKHCNVRVVWMETWGGRVLSWSSCRYRAQWWWNSSRDPQQSWSWRRRACRPPGQSRAQKNDPEKKWMVKTWTKKSFSTRGHKQPFLSKKQDILRILITFWSIVPFLYCGNTWAVPEDLPHVTLFFHLSHLSRKNHNTSKKL